MKNNISPFFSVIDKLISDEGTFFDVGAYLGDFTTSLLKFKSKLKGILFEPTIANFKMLEKKFEFNNNIKVLNLALDNSAGEKEFFIIEDTSQNSLLKFETENNASQSIMVNSETLDRFTGLKTHITMLDFIKIDTQGLDLRILEGSRDTINKFKPSILTEFIFIPLYKCQGSYYEQYQFMKEMDYNIAGIYNIHSTNTGLLAYADVLFVHSSKYSKIYNSSLQSPGFHCTDYMNVMEENIQLKHICEERLELINKISSEAEERFKIIQMLDKELKTLKG